MNLNETLSAAPHGPVAPPGEAEVARETAHFSRIQRRRRVLKESLSTLISRNSAFVWEVGCGHGHFLTAYAAAHPECLCIGVDIMRDRIERAKRKAARARLPRLHFLNADAWEFLEALPEGAEFSSIYVLFPDPWPKRRHHKNRLMQSAFLNSVARRAGDGARLYFRTDFAPYFADASAALRLEQRWESVDEAWPFESGTVFQARAATYFSLIARKK